jgi:hypothetical protein
VSLHLAKITYLVGLIVYVTVRGVFGARTKGNEKVVSRVDWRDRVLVGAVFAGSFIVPVLYVFTPLFRFADYRAPGFVMWCGAPVMVWALWLF